MIRKAVLAAAVCAAGLFPANAADVTADGLIRTASKLALLSHACSQIAPEPDGSPSRELDLGRAQAAYEIAGMDPALSLSTVRSMIREYGPAVAEIIVTRTENVPGGAEAYCILAREEVEREFQAALEGFESIADAR